MTTTAMRPSARGRTGTVGRSASVRRRLKFQGDLLGTAGTAVVVGSIALWTNGGGIHTMAALGGVATSLGRLTGLVASAMLLLQVLMMARIPWVERVWGQDQLARRHRWIGFGSFNLMIAHIVLITIGYAQAAGVNILGQAWDLVINYPGMLLATAGTVAILLVAFSSMKRARRKLRYESWHLLHLYAYVGVGLALPHQLWTGKDFLSSTFATVFWWTLWAAAAGAILIFRVGLPIVRSLRHRIVVSAVVPESPGVWSVVMTGRRLDRLGLQAGQFCQWRFLSGKGWTRAHPYSVSADPTADRIRITIKVLGDGSAVAPSLPVGTRVVIEGPYGVMTADRRNRRDVLMIGAGIGITPMRALAERIVREEPSEDLGTRRPPQVTVLHRIPNWADGTFAEEFNQLSAWSNLRVVPLVGHRVPGGSFFPGPERVDPVWALTSLVPDVADREVYLCGPRPFMTQVRTTLGAAGVDPANIHAEEFGW